MVSLRLLDVEVVENVAKPFGVVAILGTPAGRFPTFIADKSGGYPKKKRPASREIDKRGTDQGFVKIGVAKPQV